MSEEIFKRKPGVACEFVRGEAILMDLMGSQYIRLNPVGSLIWKELAEGVTVQMLVHAIRECFALCDASREAIADDVLGFLEGLVDAGLAERVEA